MSRKKHHLLTENLIRLAFVSYVSEMRRLLADCKTCLDIGCGTFSPTCYLDFEYSVGVDGHHQTLIAAQQNGTHHEYLLAGAQDIAKLFSARQFDCCVALDLIEHLTRDEGYALLEDMQRIASRKAMIFTPNGFLPQYGKNGDLQEHHSGWEVKDFQRLGFRVIGMHGPKFLRGKQHQHKIKPKVLGGIVTELLHFIYTRTHPENAAALLAVKIVT